MRWTHFTAFRRTSRTLGTQDHPLKLTSPNEVKCLALTLNPVAGPAFGASLRSPWRNQPPQGPRCRSSGPSLRGLGFKFKVYLDLPLAQKNGHKANNAPKQPHPDQNQKRHLHSLQKKNSHP